MFLFFIARHVCIARYMCDVYQAFHRRIVKNCLGLIYMYSRPSIVAYIFRFLVVKKIYLGLKASSGYKNNNFNGPINGILINPSVFAKLIRARDTDTQTTLRAKCVGKSRVSLWVRAVRPNDVITKESPSTFEPVTLLQVGLMHTLWSCIYESHFQSSATVL